jgi:hypothetical protein
MEGITGMPDNTICVAGHAFKLWKKALQMQQG